MNLLLLLCLCCPLSTAATDATTGNHTLHHIHVLLQTQRRTQANQVGTDYLFDLIAGERTHSLDAHQDHIAQVLEAVDVDVDARSEVGDTLLHASVRRGSVLVVRMLLSTNASNVNAQSKDGLQTALHLGIDYGHWEIVHHLLKIADATVVDREGRTPLHYAVLRSPPSVVQLILDTAPKSLTIQDRFGNTPLDLAQARPSSPPIVARLLRHKGDGGDGGDEGDASANRSKWRSGRDRLRGFGFYKAGAVKRKSKLRCDLDVLNVEEFEGGVDGTALLHKFRTMYYANSKPVVLRNAVKHWPGRKHLKRSRLLSEWGGLMVRTSSEPYVGGQNKTIREFVTQCMRKRKNKKEKKNNACVPNEILFDRIFHERFLHDVVATPRIAKICLPSYAQPPGLRWPQLIVSGPQAGAPFHEHQHALNGLLFGAKEWLLVPPGFAHKIVQSPLTNSAAALQENWTAAKEFLDRDNVLATCTQLAGDLLYVPRLWMHATRALEECVGVALEFCSAVGTEKYAHRERTAAELYGSAVGAGGKFVGGGEYTLENYIVPVGDGRRDFFSID